MATRILVSLDGMAPIPAWSFGTTWNGWAEPWFDAGQIDAAAAALTQGGLPTRRVVGADVITGGPESFDDCGESTWHLWERATIDTPEGPRLAWSYGGITWNDCGKDPAART